MVELPKWHQGWKTISGLVLTLLGLFLDAELVATLTELVNTITPLLPEIVEVAGVILALAGRLFTKGGPVAPQLRGG